MKFPESPRVRYTRNPLVEVICQLRFPKILRIEAEAPVGFQEALRSQYPTLNTSRAIDLQLSSELQIKLPSALIAQELTYEFIDKEGDWKIVLSGDFIALSTMKYKTWENFRERLITVVDLLVQHYSPSHFTRVGLRYQDLILRSELGLEQRPWRKLLQPAVLGTFAAENLPEQDFVEALSVFACRLDYADAILRVRYGLAREDESEELGYLIDADFYTENLLEINDATHYLDQFNRESGNFFRWCLRDELRQALQPQPIE